MNLYKGGIVWERDANHVFKKFNFFLLNIIIIIICVLDCFDVLISKIFLKNKKTLFKYISI